MVSGGRGPSCIKGRGLFVTRKRQTECMELLMAYDLKEQTMKAATLSIVRHLCCLVSRLDYGMGRSIGASKH